MSGSRDAILARTRQALGREPQKATNGNAETRDDAARSAVQARLADPKPGPLPGRTDLPLEGRIGLFTEQAQSVQASVVRIDTYADLPAAIAGYLRGHNLPLNLVTATDPKLDALPWDDGLWDIKKGRPAETDPVGLTRAVAGIAETGTLMLASDRDHPMTLAFLPGTSIITLASSEVHRSYEEAFDLLRRDRVLPRSVNLITGPSRSGDIEQTLQLGAHGPKRLLIVLVDQTDARSPAAPEKIDVEA